MDDHSSLRSAWRRWTPVLGLLVAISVASIELAADQPRQCTAERAVEELASWLTSALRRSIHTPVHGL